MAVEPISSEMLLKQIDQIKDNMEVNKLSTDNQQVQDGEFKNVFSNLIKDVDSAQKDADVSLKKLATGETNSIQDVVLKMEQADVSFRLMKEIRDKLLQAYKDIISTQG